jgi:hypothetical protein
LDRHTQTCSFEHNQDINVEDKFAAILSGKFQVCENSIEEYTISNHDTADYVWEISSGKIIDKREDTILVHWNNAGNGRIKLIKSKAFRNYLDTLVQNVTILKKPIASIHKLPNFCHNAPPYSLKEGIPSGGYFIGDGIINNVFNPDLVETGKIEIKYIYFDNPNCKDTAESYINVYPTPLTPELISRNDTLIADGFEEFYNWYKDNELIIAYGGKIYFPLNNGKYSVEAINSDSCLSDLSNSIIVNKSGVVQDKSILDFYISPNPAINNLNIETPYLGIKFYSIINMQGKILIKGVLNTQSAKIDISELVNGIYIFEFVVDNKILRKIFIKI